MATAGTKSPISVLVAITVTVMFMSTVRDRGIAGSSMDFIPKQDHNDCDQHQPFDKG